MGAVAPNKILNMHISTKINRPGFIWSTKHDGLIPDVFDVVCW